MSGPVIVCPTGAIRSPGLSGETNGIAIAGRHRETAEHARAAVRRYGRALTQHNKNCLSETAGNQAVLACTTCSRYASDRRSASDASSSKMPAGSIFQSRLRASIRSRT